MTTTRAPVTVGVSAATRVRVLIVDDHPIVREGLKRLIESSLNFEVVAEAETGEEATARVAATRPDIAIVDVSLPGIDGAQTARLLKQLNPHMKIVALTVHEDRAFMRELFEAGASAYIVKRATCDELLHALRTVVADGIYVDPRIAGALVRNFVYGEPTASGRPARLTDRETSVLQRVAEGHSNKEIASELTLSIKTVETYKTRAMEKLALRDRVDIVRYAVKQGWLHRQ